jgi:hypothetical protein
MTKPITPRQHGLIDYGFSASMLTLPSLFGMSRKARLFFAMFGATQGAVNAITDQPSAIAPLISFRTHRTVDLGSTPLYALAPLFTGVAREGKARAFWLLMGGVLVAVYNLTDWQASNTSKKSGGRFRFR